MRLAGVLVCSLGVLVSGLMIAFFMMLGGGAVRFRRVIVMFCSLMMSFLWHFISH